MILIKATAKKNCTIKPLNEKIGSAILNQGKTYYLHLDTASGESYNIYTEVGYDVLATIPGDISFMDDGKRKLTIRPLGSFNIMSQLYQYFYFDSNNIFDTDDYPVDDDSNSDMKAFVILDKNDIRRMEVTCPEGKYEILYRVDANGNYKFFYSLGMIPPNIEEFEAKLRKCNIKCKYV